MADTLRMAADIKHKFPIAGSEVYPFRPIPGTEDFDRAVELGYEPPKDFYEWGKCFEYKYNAHNTPLPEDIRETWRLYNNTAAIYDKHVTEGPQWMRDFLSWVAGWRLKTGRYRLAGSSRSSSTCTSAPPGRRSPAPRTTCPRSTPSRPDSRNPHGRVS